MGQLSFRVLDGGHFVYSMPCFVVVVIVVAFVTFFDET